MTTSVARAEFTPEQRAFAKTLVVAYGSASTARKHLDELWFKSPPADGEEWPLGVPPAPAALPALTSLERWRDHPDIPTDQALIAEFAATARHYVVGAAVNIARAAEQAVIDAIDRDEPKSAEAYMHIWEAATERLVPVAAKGQPQTAPATPMLFTGPTYVVAGREGQS